MPNQSDAFQFSLSVAAAVERAAVAFADQAVVADKPDHPNRVHRTLGKKGQCFCFELME